MSKNRVKLIIWSILLLITVILAAVVVGFLGGIVAYFQEGADPAAALNIVPNAPPDLHVRVEWLPDMQDSGREVDAYTREQIESAYLWAWMQWNISYLRGEPFGLDTYFTGPARDAVERSVSNPDLRVLQVNTAHQLQIELYTRDGALLSLTDHSAEISQIIRDPKGNILFSGESRSTYRIVMIQEEGRWRIRQMLRETNLLVDDADPLPAPRPVPDVARANGRQLELNGEPYTVYGINYYPQATPWDRFWTDYDPDYTAADFGLIRDLGLNTVRIFIPYAGFGGPVVDEAMFTSLDDLLAQAEDQGLKVIVTLFDFRTDYDLLLWPQADRHAEAIVSRYAENPTILAWDIKNEPDLDYQSNSRMEVDGWLAHMARHIRTLDPYHLITVGWASAEAAQAATVPVDVVSFHDYRPPAELSARLNNLRAVVDNRPILLGEFGLPTWNSIFPNGHTEAEQAVYYADVMRVVREHGISGSLAWTLYDFAFVPPSVAGRMPWQSGPQTHLGVLRSDGTAKPAAALLAPNAPLEVPAIPVYARFLKPFWLMVLGCAGLAVLACGFLVIRYIRSRRKLPRTPSSPRARRVRKQK